MKLRNCQDRWLLGFRRAFRFSLKRLIFSDSPNLTNQALLFAPPPIHLQTLSLRNCIQINTGLSLFSTSTQLTDLDLSGCSSIDDYGFQHLSTLTQMEKLNIQNCSSITDASIYLISYFTSLKYLNISYNSNLTDTSLYSITRLIQLQDLNISFNMNFSYSALIILSHLTNLTKLNVCSCSIHPITMQSYFALPVPNPNPTSNPVPNYNNNNVSLQLIPSNNNLIYLTYLNISSNNEINDSSILLLNNCKNLISLDMSRCPFVYTLPRGLSHQLKYLNLSYNSQLRESAYNLLTEFKLIHLDLESVMIPDTMPTIISNLTTLEILNLKDTDADSLIISSLSLLTNLNTLNLFYCCPSRPSHINCLSVLSSLTDLNLDSAHIEDESLRPIMSLSNLKYLDLFSARISDVGALFLTCLTKLRSLRICGARLSTEGVRYLSQLYLLEELNISNNARVTSEVSSLMNYIF